MKPVDQRLLARGAAAHLALCVGVGVVAAVLVVVQAELLATGVAERADHRAVAGTALFLALVVVARAVAVGLVEKSSVSAAARAKQDLRVAVLAAGAAGAAAEGTDRARIVTLVTRGVDALDDYIGRYLPALAVAGIVPLVVGVRLLTLDLTTAITVALTVPLIPVFMALVGWMTESAVARRHRELERLARHVLDVATGMGTLVLFGRGSAQGPLVRETSERSRMATNSTLRIAFLSALVLEVIATLSVALVAVGVGVRLVDGGLDLRTGLLLIILAPEAYLPLRRLGVLHHASADAVAVMDSIDELTRPPVAPCSAAVPGLGRGASIQMTAVSVVRADRGIVAPDDLDVVAEAGRVTALVGDSGTGKTTALRIVAGLLVPSGGSVTVHGVDRSVALTELAADEWHRHLTYVPQEPYVVAGTLRDNLVLAAPDATGDDITVALRSVGLEHLGADHLVGRDGRGLSAGERRRVGVARAVVRRSAVVLLDEPTAGLDEDNEAAVVASLRVLADAGAIVIVATHRSVVVDTADRSVDVVARVVVDGTVAL